MTIGTLPPGQRARSDFPRFGLDKYADRFPNDPNDVTLTIGGDVATACAVVSSDLDALPRVDQLSDFHCVTTWSTCGLSWSGVRFADFHEQLIVPRAQPAPDATLVVLRGQDGYRTSLPIDDLLDPQVLLANRLADAPLSIPHGAPIRLVAPAHYGYKNVKHVKAIEFWRDGREYRPAGFVFMDHPRARVEFEERGRGLPGWAYRLLYRPLVARTASRFRRAWERRQGS